MASVELFDHLRATLPRGYDYLAQLDSGAVSVCTGDDRWGHSMATVEVRQDGNAYVVEDDGWVASGWLGTVEHPELSEQTRARIAEIAKRERIPLDGLSFVASGIERDELSDTVVRMLRALHAVVDLDPLYAGKPQVAAAD